MGAGNLGALLNNAGALGLEFRGVRSRIFQAVWVSDLRVLDGKSRAGAALPPYSGLARQATGVKLGCSCKIFLLGAQGLNGES